MNIKSFIILLILIALSSCKTPTEAMKEKERPVQITILHINDSHGAYMKYKDKDGPDVGGFAAISTLVKSIREEVEDKGGMVLFLHGGDFNTGMPESDLLEGMPDIKALNAMKLDAIVVGNHEFDKPFDILEKQMDEAKFPFLTANVSFKDKKKNKGILGTPFIKKTFKDLNIYIFGLTSNDLKGLILPERFSKLELKNPIIAAKDIIKTFEPNSLIIALTHMGVKEDASDDIGDVELAKEVPSIDVIVGGHGHQVFHKPIIQGKTYILQAGYKTKWLGRLDIKVDNGEVIDYRYRLIPINLKMKEKKGDKETYALIDKEIKEDEKILDIIAPYLKKADLELSKTIGTNEKNLSRDGAESGEIALGDLLTDAMAEKGGCEVAIQGVGGIRADLPQGEVSIRHALMIHPFRNTIYRTKLTGTELLEVFKFGFSKIGSGAFIQVSGIKAEINKADKSLNLREVKGTTFQKEKEYVLCSDNFLASGGDGYEVLKNLKNKIDTGYMVHEGLIDFIKKRGKVNYEVLGRIVVK